MQTNRLGEIEILKLYYWLHERNTVYECVNQSLSESFHYFRCYILNIIFIANPGNKQR